MSGVEEGSGASWLTHLGDDSAQEQGRSLLPLSSNRGHCSGQDFLLASIDTFPEGLLPSTMVEADFESGPGLRR